MATAKQPSNHTAKNGKTPQVTLDDNDTVSLHTTFSGSIFKGMSQCKKVMGLQGEQDVVRLAVAVFLERNGYVKK